MFKLGLYKMIKRILDLIPTHEPEEDPFYSEENMRCIDEAIAELDQLGGEVIIFEVDNQDRKSLEDQSTI